MSSIQPLDIDVNALLDALHKDVRQCLTRRAWDHPLMVGIHSGGVWVAEYLHRAMQLPDPLGHINIAFYRDDFSRIGLHPRVTPSALPFDVKDRYVVLVDDVLYTGRTIRAALNELFDYGRPAGVMLAVLVDRGGRELPIQADSTALRMELEAPRQVKLNGPEPLILVEQTPL